jgi:L-lactate utilization protein LutB
VNAVSLDPPSIFIVQHFQNISGILGQAEKVFFVAGMEKVVEKKDDALFQSKCCALFGADNIAVGIPAPAESGMSMKKTKSAASVMPAPPRKAPELHLVLLDNGRKKLAKSEFRELLYCIGCNGCAAFCPRERNEKYTTRSPRELLQGALTGNLEHASSHGLFNCTVCEHCKHRCPVDIDIPRLVIRLREKSVETGFLPEALRRIRENVENYGNPYGKA